MKMEDSKCNELQTQNHKPLVWKRGGAGQYNKAFGTMQTALKLGYWSMYNNSYSLPFFLKLF